jgi:exosortase/archaeosortase family protein
MKINKAFMHELLKGKSFQALRDVALFAVLIISFHYLYLLWIRYDFYPFKTQVDQLFVFASGILFNQSSWLVEHVFHLNYKLEGQNILILSRSGEWGFVGVSPDCTSLKQWLHWIFLMVLFPGPWKHKLWYIPAGIVVIHFVNIIRIVGLSLVLVPWPQHFNFFHDYIFKTFFYFMIFLMWVIWVEVFAHRIKKTAKYQPDAVISE